MCHDQVFAGASLDDFFNSQSCPAIQVPITFPSPTQGVRKDCEIPVRGNVLQRY